MGEMNPNAKPITDAYAMAFFNFARDYQSAADQLAALGPHCASNPINLLYFHAVEMALKAYLRSMSLPILGTKRQSHDLVKLYNECQTLGLAIDPADRLDVLNIVNLLGAANEEHGFRYFNLKSVVEPELQWTRAAVEKLMWAVEPAVKSCSERDGSTPGVAVKVRMRFSQPVPK